MSSERENVFQPITPIDYNIAGNVFRAYYDADKKLVFVIDSVITDIKPNVLLVINPVGDRKWDDILLNDYGVDLETVRPKQYNKYQKLDIEYTGLSVYDDLIQKYNAGQDLTDAVHNLMEFRREAALRAAKERLDAANVNANRARETIDRTKSLIYDLQVRLKELRAKAATQRRDIGKEPTKKSAAKILRTEAQIDATSDKIARAKKRLAKAQRRLTIAEDDAEIAQSILNRLADVNLPTTPMATQIVTHEDPPVPYMQNITFTDVTNNDIIPQTEVQEMAENNEDVKPLFDTDPEIIDEEIAFKPIDFGTPAVDEYRPETVTETDFSADAPSAPSVQPLSFTPPVGSSFDDAPSAYGEDTTNSAPASDSFTPVPIIEETAIENPSEYETLTGWGDDNGAVASEYNSDSYAAAPVTETSSYTDYADTPAPVVPDMSAYDNNSGNDMSEIGVAPVDSDFRPVSPISGTTSGETAVEYMPETSDVGEPVGNKKPSFLYYILLLLLIGLSVFTLWLYQQSMNGNLPELGAKTEMVTAEPVFDETPAPLPEPVAVPVMETVVETIEEIEPIVELEPVVEPEALIEEEPVVVEEEPEFIPEPVSVIKSLRYVEEEPEPVVLETEEEILAKKPAYGVSQNENMFVAAPEYETENVEQEVIETCSDGNMPDGNGCCAGEVFTYMDDGTYACCVDDTDSCFPPMF